MRDFGTATVVNSRGINLDGLTDQPARTDLGSYLSKILKLLKIHHEPEYHFAKPRLWRFDIAFPDCKLAVECDGGLYIPGGGGHNSPEGFLKDLEKRNRAQLMGWAVLVVTGGMIDSGEAVKLIEEGLKARFSWQKAIENIRDAVLHERFQLAEMNFGSDIINAVLGIIDDNVPPTE